MEYLYKFIFQMTKSNTKHCDSERRLIELILKEHVKQCENVVKNKNLMSYKLAKHILEIYENCNLLTTILLIRLLNCTPIMIIKKRI